MTKRILPDWLAQVRDTIPGWIKKVKHNDGPGRYRFAIDAHEPYDLDSSSMIFIVRRTIGDEPDDKERDEWIEYILSHQREEDGLIIDEHLERHLGKDLGNPTEEELFDMRRWTTRNFLNAVVAMGGEPRYPLTHEEAFDSPVQMVDYMENLHWHSPWGAGSWAGAAIVFQHFNRLLGDDRADDIIRAGLDWLIRNQRPDNGAWHDGSYPPLYNQINGIFKVWIQLIPITDLPVQYPEQIIDLCIQGLKEDPKLKGTPDTCSIFDVALVLDTALRFTDHRSDEVAEICAGHLPLLAPMVQADGAFSYYPGRSLPLHGDIQLATPKPQSEAVGTALLCQAAAMLCNLCGLRNDLGWLPTTETIMLLPPKERGLYTKVPKFLEKSEEAC